MEQRTLGPSGLQISAVMLGTWSYGGRLWGGRDDEKAIETIREAVERGVTAIDTAPVYGLGHSEVLLGRAIQGLRDRVVIATKCGLRWDRPGRPHKTFTDERGREVVVSRLLSRESILEEIDASRLRLGVDVIDLYQCHWPDPGTSIQETMETLCELRDRGTIRAIGVSNFGVDEMRECMKFGVLSSDQPKYNMLEREIEADVLPFCREHNIGVLCYSPLAHGILTGKVGMEREFTGDDLRREHPLYTPDRREKTLRFLERIKPIAEKYGKTLAQLALNWTIHQPGVTAAIVGARRPEQIDENVGGADWRISREDAAFITVLLDEMRRGPDLPGGKG